MSDNEAEKSLKFLETTILNETVENLLRVPVVRDVGFRSYSPNAFSVWPVADPNGTRIRCLLHNIETAEQAHYVDASNTTGQELKKKDVRIEVKELGELVIGVAQAKQLVTDLSALLKSFEAS